MRSMLSVAADPIYLLWMRLVSLSIALLCASCAGQVESSIQVTPPPRAPTPAATTPVPATPEAPVDGDGDGVLSGDACPDAPETKNGFEDEDGCPDTLPDFWIDQQTIRYTGELKFGLLGGLRNESQPAIDGIAALIEQNDEIELVEIAAHVTTTGDVDKKSRDHASAVKKALTKAGIESRRLRAVGYGKRCPEGGSRVELTVVRRGGAETGAELCSK